MKKILFLGLFLFMFTNLFAQKYAIEGIAPTDYNNKNVGVFLYYADTTTTPWTFHQVFDTSGVMTVKDLAYNLSLDANSIVVLNQPQYHYPATAVLVDSSDVGVGTAYVYYNVASYKYSTIAVNFDDSTSAKFFSSIYASPDFTDATSGDWGDITTAVVGADSVAFGTNTNYYIGDAIFPNEWILIEYKKYGTTNSIDLATKKGY